eukprot:15353876-Ditylum_brightwellii.AAC.1
MEGGTAWKLGEFSSPGRIVQCISISPKSKQLIAAGGDDKKVQILKLDQMSKPLQTLTGNTSPVLATLFDFKESAIITGSAGGSVKMFDLLEERVVRSFSGHLSSVVTLAHHPHGDYISSGGDDTNVRI